MQCDFLWLELLCRIPIICKRLQNANIEINILGIACCSTLLYSRIRQRSLFHGVKKRKIDFAKRRYAYHFQRHTSRFASQFQWLNTIAGCCYHQYRHIHFTCNNKMDLLAFLWLTIICRLCQNGNIIEFSHSKWPIHSKESRTRWDWKENVLPILQNVSTNNICKVFWTFCKEKYSFNWLFF